MLRVPTCYEFPPIAEPGLHYVTWNLGIAGGGMRGGAGGGGRGGAQALAGGSDNILIGGSTVYDQDLIALLDIMRVWDDPTMGFDTRVNALLKGVTINGRTVALNKSTVLRDKSPSSLVGGAGQNWFIVDADDTINNGNGPGANDRLTRI